MVTLVRPPLVRFRLTTNGYRSRRADRRTTHPEAHPPPLCVEILERNRSEARHG
jgi:hypothetical protein